MGDPSSTPNNCGGSIQRNQSGVSAGREIQDLMGEVGKAVGGIRPDQAATTPPLKASPPSSVVLKKKPMSEFIAKTKAREMEDELRELIQYTRGADAWNELIRMRGEARKRRKEEKPLTSSGRRAD